MSVGHCFINVVRCHCYATTYYSNDIGSHYCATPCSTIGPQFPKLCNNYPCHVGCPALQKNTWNRQTDTERPIKCPSLTLRHKKHLKTTCVTAPNRLEQDLCALCTGCMKWTHNRQVTSICISVCPCVNHHYLLQKYSTEIWYWHFDWKLWSEFKFGPHQSNITTNWD